MPLKRHLICERGATPKPQEKQMSAGAVRMANTIASHGASIASHNTELANLRSAIANHNTRITNHGVNISANVQAIIALGTKCTRMEGDAGALKLKVTTLEQKDILQNQTNSQFRQRLDRSDASVNWFDFRMSFC